MSKRKERKREKGLDAEILTMKTRKCFEREKVMVMRWNPSEALYLKIILDFKMGLITLKFCFVNKCDRYAFLSRTIFMYFTIKYVSHKNHPQYFPSACAQHVLK